MNHAEELKSSGLKATLPRIKILEVFQQTAQRHMTAEDVYKVLLAEGSDIGLATVYRVLMQFEQAGILSRNHFEAGKAVFACHGGHGKRRPVPARGEFQLRFLVGHQQQTCGAFGNVSQRLDRAFFQAGIACAAAPDGAGEAQPFLAVVVSVLEQVLGGGHAQPTAQS